MYHYACYGLHIASELIMPEMSPCNSAAAVPDVHIRLAGLSATGPANARQLHARLWVGDNVLRLHIPGIARYEVRDGREILLDAHPDADPLSLRLFLQGSALGALLMQRNYLVLHGNAIRVGDVCMICVGDSGAGKSTLAAAFLQRGHDILADDVVPIDENGFAIPGFPRIKLWQDAAEHLDIATTHLAPIQPGMDKFNLPLFRDEQALTPLPVRWIYVLDWHEAGDLRLEPIQGLARFTLLHKNTYRVGFLADPPARARHMTKCVRLAERVHMRRVMRPADKSLTPAQTAALLLADMAAAAQSSRCI